MVANQKYLKNYKLLNDHFPVMSLEFQNFPDKVIEDSFDQKNFNRKDYKELIVEQGRIELSKDRWVPEFQLFVKELLETIKYISLKLLECDPIRYPIHTDIERWFDYRFMNAGCVAVFPVIDNPGYHMPWHLDNRLILISGVINVQDNCVGTLFTKYNRNWENKNFCGPSTDIAYQASTKKYTGTAWLNTEKTWHAVPEVKDPRKIFLFNVFV